MRNNELLAMYAVTGCDTTSYPYNKSKTFGLNVLLKYDDAGLECFEEIIEAGTKFFSYSSMPVTMSSL